MKCQIRIFIDGYETTVKNLKAHEIKPIIDSIFEFIREKHFSFPIEMTRYDDSVALKMPIDFKQFVERRIHLNPFGFHKPLEIEFAYIDDNDNVHYCNNVWCEGYCGTLHCGCIDVCRGRCN